MLPLILFACTFDAIYTCYYFYLLPHSSYPYEFLSSLKFMPPLIISNFIYFCKYLFLMKNRLISIFYCFFLLFTFYKIFHMTTLFVVSFFYHTNYRMFASHRIYSFNLYAIHSPHLPILSKLMSLHIFSVNFPYFRYSILKAKYGIICFFDFGRRLMIFLKL